MMNFFPILAAIVVFGQTSTPVQTKISGFRTDLPFNVRDRHSKEGDPERVFAAWTKERRIIPERFEASPRDLIAYTRLRQGEKTWLYAPPGIIFAVSGDEVVAHGAAPSGFGGYMAEGELDYFISKNVHYLPFVFGVSQENVDVRRCSELPQVIRKFLLKRGDITIIGRGPADVEYRKLVIRSDDAESKRRIADSFELASDLVSGGSGSGSGSFVIERERTKLVVRLSGQFDIEHRPKDERLAFYGIITLRASKTLAAMFGWPAVVVEKPQFATHVEFADRLKKISRAGEPSAWAFSSHTYYTTVFLSDVVSRNLPLQERPFLYCADALKCEPAELPFRWKGYPPHAVVIENNAGTIVASSTGLVGVGPPRSLKFVDRSLTATENLTYCWTEGGYWKELAKAAGVPLYFQATCRLRQN